MTVSSPENLGQLTDLLSTCQREKRSISITGAQTKLRQAGPLAAADLRLDLTKLNRVLAYDPRDLTVSVEAGMLWRDLEAMLAEKGQMVALDPPWAASATVGGVLAANSSGPRRRLYGTARDLVIGMTFATLEGKIVQSGGMVVKNVAGLDFAKLLIGSFGTLAPIATANFKLMPKPKAWATFLLQSDTAGPVFAERNRLLKSVLQPTGLDIANPTASSMLGLPAKWSLVVEAAGSTAVLARYQKELPSFTQCEEPLFARLREFTPHYLEQSPQASVVRLSLQLQDMEAILSNTSPEVAMIARAASGVAYLHSPQPQNVPAGQIGLIDFSPAQRPAKDLLWPRPSEDFFLMERIKLLFDPDRLLNSGRLYGRL